MKRTGAANTPYGFPMPSQFPNAPPYNWPQHMQYPSLRPPQPPPNPTQSRPYGSYEAWLFIHGLNPPQLTQGPTHPQFTQRHVPPQPTQTPIPPQLTQRQVPPRSQGGHPLQTPIQGPHPYGGHLAQLGWHPHNGLPHTQGPRALTQQYARPADIWGPPAPSRPRLQAQVPLPQPPLPLSPQNVQQQEKEIIEISDDEEIEQADETRQLRSPTAAVTEPGVPKPRKISPPWLQSTAVMGLQTALHPEILADPDKFNAAQAQLREAQRKQYKLSQQKKKQEMQRAKEVRRQQKEEKRLRAQQQKKKEAAQSKAKKLEQEKQKPTPSLGSKKRKSEESNPATAPAMKKVITEVEKPSSQPLQPIDMEESLLAILMQSDDEPATATPAPASSIHNSDEMDAELDRDLFGDSDDDLPPVPEDEQENEQEVGRVDYAADIEVTELPSIAQPTLFEELLVEDEESEISEEE